MLSPRPTLELGALVPLVGDELHSLPQLLRGLSLDLELSGLVGQGLRGVQQPGLQLGDHMQILRLLELQLLFSFLVVCMEGLFLVVVEVHLHLLLVGKVVLKEIPLPRQPPPRGRPAPGTLCLPDPDHPLNQRAAATDETGRKAPE